MTVELSLGALVVTGLLAAGVWVDQVRRHRPRRSTVLPAPGAVALAGWALATASAGAAGLVTADPGHPLVPALLAAGLLGAAAVISVSAHRSGRPPGAWTAGRGAGSLVAEAALTGSSLVSIFWAGAWLLGGAPAHPSLSTIVALALTTADLTAAALLLRLPEAANRAGRDRVAAGVAALGLLALADAVLTLQHLGVEGAGAASPALRGLACVLVAVVPWLPAITPRIPEPAASGPGPVLSAASRALPYALVAAAVGIHLVISFRRPVGPVSLALAAVAVSGLAVVQGLGLRENARLVRDLATSRSKLKALVDNAGDVILGLDATGCVVSANAAAARLLHRTPEAMTGMDVADLALPQHRAPLRAVVDPVVRGWRSTGRAELALAPPATGTAELRLQSVAGGAVANLSDVTDSVQLRDRLERLARFDEMTGLPNRTHLIDEIDGWLRVGRPVSVLYTDLDGFKAVNDRFGHRCGDDVLVEAARRLQAAVHGVPADRVLVARMGGDEFVVALLDVRPENLAFASQRMVNAMRPTFSVADREVRVGLCVGVASSDDHVPAEPAVDPALGGAIELLHRADVAMFAAKQAGRFRIMHWDAAMEARAVRRVDIAIGLRRALEGRRLALAYQPIVRLADGVVIGVEALIRVSGEDRGPGSLGGLPDLVTPAEVVAVAEDTDEIAELGHWVLDEATAQAARWRASGHDVFVTVNVSVRQMSGEGFVESVSAALEATRLPAGNLVVEITEGQLLSEQDPAWLAVEQLRALGVALVIDDFGSGYSSLAYLRRMPVRGVKLDRALLDDLTTDARARTLARAVIAAARALGLLVVAEGLETLEAARVVRDLGAFAGQGFALFEALPADEVARALAGAPVSLGGHRSRRVSAPSTPPSLPLNGSPAGRLGHPGPMAPVTLDLTGEPLPREASADLT